MSMETLGTFFIINNHMAMNNTPNIIMNARTRITNHVQGVVKSA